MVTNSLLKEMDRFPEYDKEKSSTWVIVLANSIKHSDLERKIAAKSLHSQSNKGARCALEHAWDQAQQLANDDHIVTTALTGHQRFYREIGKSNIPGKIIYQPPGHGTASTVYLALAHVIAKEPFANVVILPCTNTLQPVKTFTQLIGHALQHVIDSPTNSGLLCIRPADYKYTEASLSDPIVKLHDQPKKMVSKTQLRKKELSSANIVVSKANLLWALCKHLLPDLFERMEYVYQVILHFKEDDSFSNDYVKMASSHAFYHLAAYNFTKDIIFNCLNKSDIVEMKYLQWDIWDAPTVAL
jgi:mannose-1-phosphate guanylyltransferase